MSIGRSGLGLATVVLFGAVQGPAHAQGAFVGVGGGASSWALDCAGTSTCDKSGGAFKLYGGYNFTPQFGVQAFYLDLGKARTAAPVSGTLTNVDYKGQAYGVSGTGTFDITKDLVLLGELGLANVTGKVEGTALGVSVSEKKNSVALVVGGGIGYRVTPAAMLRAEVMATTVKVRLNSYEDSGGVAAFLVGISGQF